MERKRILFIVPRFGTVTRGVESFALELITRLDKHKFDITVLSNPHSIDIKDVRFIKIKTSSRENFKWLDQTDLLRKFTRQIDLGSGADIESLLLCTQYFWKQLKNHKFDVVLPLGGTWTYRLAKYFIPKASIISIGQAGPVKRDLKLSDWFVALTPFDQSRAKGMVPTIPTSLIPNGVDTTKFKPSSESIKSDKKVILCVAALAKDKRHDLLFNAVMLLPEHIKVLCVGTGPHQSELQKHPLYLAGRVEFRSASYKDMPNIYHEADIFSLASPEEAFGIVFLEAIASGLRVVAHNGPRQQFVVGKNGSLTNCFNTKNYAESLFLEISSNVAKVITNPVDFKKFSWDVICNSYEQLFSINKEL